MVSNASDDLPDPDRPVITISLSRGRSTSMFLRLWVRAPRILMASISGGSAEAMRQRKGTPDLGATGRARNPPGGGPGPPFRSMGWLDPGLAGPLQFRFCPPIRGQG